jgi:hypothetical protein
MDNFFCPDFKSFLEFIALFDTPYFEIDHDDSHPFFFNAERGFGFLQDHFPPLSMPDLGSRCLGGFHKTAGCINR